MPGLLRAGISSLLRLSQDTEFEIDHGDTLKNDWDFLREMYPAKMPKFDAVAANPPFSLKWDPGDAWRRTCVSRTIARLPIRN